MTFVTLIRRNIFHLHSEEYAVFYTFDYFIQCLKNFLFISSAVVFCPIAFN